MGVRLRSLLNSVQLERYAARHPAEEPEPVEPKTEKKPSPAAKPKPALKTLSASGKPKDAPPKAENASD